jgi:hypothetical protein
MTDPAHLISHRSVDTSQAVRGDRCRVFTRERRVTSRDLWGSNRSIEVPL